MLEGMRRRFFGGKEVEEVLPQSPTRDYIFSINSFRKVEGDNEFCVWEKQVSTTPKKRGDKVRIKIGRWSFVFIVDLVTNGSDPPLVELELDDVTPKIFLSLGKALSKDKSWEPTPIFYKACPHCKPKDPDA